MLNINTTQVPFENPQSFGEHQDPPCHGLALCVWRPHAQDPCVVLLLCPNITIINVTSATAEPDITPGPKSISPIKPKIYVKPDTDDWFKITTGISKIDNNWLLMAEQAARAAKNRLCYMHGSQTSFASCTLSLRSHMLGRCNE